MRKLYIFDMGGVVTTTFSIENRLEKILNISIKDFYKFCGCASGSESFSSSSEKNYDSNSLDLLTMCSNGIIDSKEFWRLFSQRSGCKVQTDWWHWLFHPELNEETVKIIQTLKANGNRVVCGTNTIDSHYRNHLERGDYSFFDQTYTSCLMGFSKPDPMFWNIILTSEDINAKDAVFIDDKKINCDAAQKLGIHSILFTNAKDLAKELGIVL